MPLGNATSNSFYREQGTEGFWLGWQEGQANVHEQMAFLNNFGHPPPGVTQGKRDWLPRALRRQRIIWSAVRPFSGSKRRAKVAVLQEIAAKLRLRTLPLSRTQHSGGPL